ncbi:high-temperature-induced dauer-formation protein-domain-containing protein [Vararia minispora EC-137]|uniref:High-temperature-induced dauer-formation protein-domain-containing protein n=1 Tax=Vararia minispora EC-137 TaxID=1314806 RepID=A0ACB8QP47_9AGAM|nr:high-temperature-induced dauer-formation protein-domain-containing protein [Vararia minispora EC-137]
MVGCIPQKLSAPFGLLGDEAKLAFRSQPEGIAKLASTRNIPETDNYWDQYITLFDSASDVFSLISPHDIRRALVEAPENVATLLRVVTSRLFNLVSDHTFPSPPANTVTSVTKFASAFIKAGAIERSPTKEVLNCIRVLQRTLPVVFELDSDLSIFEQEVFWRQDPVEGQEFEEQVEQTPQFVIENDDEDGPSASSTPSSTAPCNTAPKGQKRHPALAERLFSCLVDLLFCCGFTLPKQIQVDHYKISYIIWEKGVGSTVDPGPSHTFDSNKAEVLRLILVLLSRQIYVPPSTLLTNPSRYSLHFVQRTPRRDVLTLLCSLLNTAMNSPNAPNNVIGNVAGRLPYNHLVFKGEDPRANLVSMCFQVLCALLDFQSGTARDALVSSGDSPIYAPTLKTNAFRHFTAKLHRPTDFDFVIDGILGILEQQMVTIVNLLPGARKSVPYISETIILTWKMIELNKKFRAYLLEKDKSMDIISYLLCYFLEIKDKPQQHGVCRAISYIIQTLSAESSFGLKLSFPLKTAHLPAKWNVGGAAADFMINAIYFIVATTSGALNSVYPALIISLSNAAPYFRDLTVNSSTRLLQLFVAFSNPIFLLADEGNPRLLFFLLEAFNAVILHHLPENPNLTYAVLRLHKNFEDLGTFNLARGLREVKRIQQAKEEQALQAADRRGKTRATDEQAHEEKQRLLEREGSALGLRGVSPHSSLADVRIVPQTSLPEDPSGESEQSISTPPVTNPGTETPASATFTISEKAKGKMRERRSQSLDDDQDLASAAAGVGRNGFVPTQEWVTSWQQGLPLDPVMILISELMPKVQDLQSQGTASSTRSIIELLSRANLLHLLPQPPPLNPRRFVWSEPSIVWLSSLIWGEIYVRGMSPLGVWNSTNVRLFYVKHAQNQPRQLTEAVVGVVGGLLGRQAPDSPRLQRGNSAPRG